MRVTDVEVFLLQKPLTSTMRISRGGFTTRSHCLVRVTTDAGITGLGEGIGTAAAVKGIVEQHMRSVVIGKNPLEIENIRSLLLDAGVYFERKGSAICAASAIEMACFDIKGKALQLPVYELLGGKCRDKVELYASDVYWEEDPSSVGRNGARIVEQGIKTVKAHLGVLGPKEETIRVKALRNFIGSECNLMIDLNCGYSFVQAKEAVQRWAEFDLTWLEEPLNPNHLRLMKELREVSSIPIASGENEFQIFGFKDLFDSAAVDIAMPDIGRVGGLLETKYVSALAFSYGIEVSPHNFSSGVLLAATMHLMAATPGTRLLEYDTSENAIYDELFIEPPTLDNGYLSVVDTPGLGVELSEKVLEKYNVKRF